MDNESKKINSGEALLVTIITVFILMALGIIIIKEFYSRVLPEQPLFLVLALIGFIGICILVLLMIIRGRS